AQRQESSLVDRLLRPNMELQNDAQTKKFTANSTIAERKGSVGTFYLQPNRTEKKFADERSYSTTRRASSRAFNSGRNNVVAETDYTAAKTARLGSSNVLDVRSVHDANQGLTTRQYPEEQREFKEQGKSQKSLDRKNPPLTIDQVRELLNKNK